MFKPNERQKEIIRFLTNFPGLYTVSDIAQAIDRPLSTSLRTDVNVLLAAGKIARQVVSSDSNRLAWGYAIVEVLPELL